MTTTSGVALLQFRNVFLANAARDLQGAGSALATVAPALPTSIRRAYRAVSFLPFCSSAIIRKDSEACTGHRAFTFERTALADDAIGFGNGLCRWCASAQQRCTRRRPQARGRIRARRANGASTHHTKFDKIEVSRRRAPVSSSGQDTWFSTMEPGFDSPVPVAPATEFDGDTGSTQGKKRNREKIFVFLRASVLNPCLRRLRSRAARISPSCRPFRGCRLLVRTRAPMHASSVARRAAWRARQRRPLRRHRPCR